MRYRNPVRNSGHIALSATALFLVTLAGSSASRAQSSDVNLALHAKGHATAADIGMPEYPGSKPYKDPDNDGAVDLGFSFGETSFRVMAASYVTGDSPDQVLAFYRKPLSKFGEVLECDHGKPVGSRTVAKGGLTCSGEHGGNIQMNGSGDSSDDHELRVGTPHKFRIVGIDKSHTGSTRFGLVYIELPKDEDKKSD